MAAKMKAKPTAVLFEIFAFSSHALAESQVWASYYAKKYVGRPTASGERYDPKALTAAHPTLPLGSTVEVRRWTDGATVVVRINDRGPFTHSRVMDLSKAAAQEIEMIRSGTATVKLEVMEESKAKAEPPLLADSAQTASR